MLKIIGNNQPTCDDLLVEWGRSQDPTLHWIVDPLSASAHLQFVANGHRYNTKRVLFNALRGVPAPTRAGRPGRLFRTCSEPRCVNPYHHAARDVGPRSQAPEDSNASGNGEPEDPCNVEPTVGYTPEQVDLTLAPQER